MYGKSWTYTSLEGAEKIIKVIPSFFFFYFSGEQTLCNTIAPLLRIWVLPVGRGG